MTTAVEAPLFRFVPTGAEKEFGGLRHAVTVISDKGTYDVGVDISTEVYTFLNNVLQLRKEEDLKKVEFVLERPVSDDKKYVFIVEYVDTHGHTEYMDLWHYSMLPEWAQIKWKI